MAHLENSPEVSGEGPELGPQAGSGRSEGPRRPGGAGKFCPRAAALGSQQGRIGGWEGSVLESALCWPCAGWLEEQLRRPLGGVLITQTVVALGVGGSGEGDTSEGPVDFCPHGWGIYPQADANHKELLVAKRQKPNVATFHGLGPGNQGQRPCHEDPCP